MENPANLGVHVIPTANAHLVACWLSAACPLQAILSELWEQAFESEPSQQRTHHALSVAQSVFSGLKQSFLMDSSEFSCIHNIVVAMYLKSGIGMGREEGT